MPSESLLSDKDITTASYFYIEGDASKTPYGLDMLPRCPGNAILNYELPSGRVLDTPPTPAELIKGEVVIGWCNSVRAQDTDEREGASEENEIIRQTRIKAEDRSARELGYESHHHMLEQVGGADLLVRSVPLPGEQLTDGGIALPLGASVPSAEETDIPSEPAPGGGSIIERLQQESSDAVARLGDAKQLASNIEDEIRQLNVAIEALS
jgi:hypothetical protein